MSKFIPMEALAERAQSWASAGLRVVTTNGCFDLLHLGHITYLQEARALGDILVVGLNSDESVRRLKGPTRPLFPERVRVEQLAALECVDFVTVFSEGTPEVFLGVVHPAVHVKGGDYLPEQLPERAVVEAGGGEVRCLSLVPGYSTTSILERLKLLSDEEAGPHRQVEEIHLRPEV